MWLHRRNKIRQAILSLSVYRSLSLSLHTLLFSQPGKQKKKFSSFFKSLVIELDKELYGPDNHLVEVWHHFENIWCELLESSSDSAFFLQLCTSSTHVSVLISVNVQTFCLNFLLVAQNAHHSGDRRLPGEKAWWHQCEMHSSFHAGSPGTTGWPARLFSRCPFDWLVTICSQPPQYKLDPRLARLLGVHTQTRASIMQALWLYIKNNKLQDCHEKEYINCNRYFRQVSNPQAPFVNNSNVIAECTSIIGSFNKWTVFFFFMILWGNRHYKLVSGSSATLLFRSLAVLAWDLLKFPWSWRVCCSIPTP